MSIATSNAAPQRNRSSDATTALLSARLGPSWPRVATLMFLSGLAALGYQIVWTQQLGVWLGHEVFAVLAVLTAFFGGLGAGALAFGQRVARAVRPWRWYAAFEAVIAVWSAVLALLLPAASSALLRLIGAEPAPAWHWSIVFGGAFLLLLPATAAMGGTLPAMERAFARLRTEGYGIGGLYAANTAGAVGGVALAAFVLPPRVGLTATAVLCAATSAVVAVLAFAASRRVAVAGVAVPAARGEAGTAARPAHRVALAALAVAGFLGIGFEVVAVRALSQLAQNTVHTFAMLLAVYLLSTAVGAALYQRYLAHRADAARLRAGLLATVALACLGGVGALAAAPALDAAVAAAAGSGLAAAVLGEGVLAVAVFALPAMLMGALFSHLCVEAKTHGQALGTSLAANTAGAALAPPLIGLWLMPTLGAQALLAAFALAYVALAYIALTNLGPPHERRRRPRAALVSSALVGAVAVAVLVWAPPLVFVAVPPGGRILSHRDGVMAAVSVIEDAAGVRTLHINNREQEGSSATEFADARQAWLPLVMHGAVPKSALFLGLGTGVTAAAAARSRVPTDVVELLPEVAAAAPYFVPEYAHDGARGKPRIVTADARRYVRAAGKHYDLVVADLFHPARSGSGSLYTIEHFAAIRERLAPGGLFCQWLPLHQLEIDTLRSIVASFLAVYPQGAAILATNSLDTPVIGLVARRDPAPVMTTPLAAGFVAQHWDETRAALKLDDALAVAGSFVAGPKALADFAADAPLNTDDRPVVAYRAPRDVFASSLPRGRLLALLSEWRTSPREVFAAADARASARVTAYWEARNRYVAVGMHVRPTSDVREMLAQVREPLLGVLRTSPDFRPAYDPLLEMAVVLARVDRPAARTLLEALASIQPGRGDAALVLEHIAPAETPFQPPH